MFLFRWDRLLGLVVGSIVGSALVLVGTAAYRSGGTWQALRSTAPIVVATQGPTITALQGLEELATVRIHIADVLTANDGTYSGAWLIKGDALIAVDLSQARFDDDSIDFDHKCAVLVL